MYWSNPASSYELAAIVQEINVQDIATILCLDVYNEAIVLAGANKPVHQEVMQAPRGVADG